MRLERFPCAHGEARRHDQAMSRTMTRWQAFSARRSSHHGGAAGYVLDGARSPSLARHASWTVVGLSLLALACAPREPAAPERPRVQPLASAAERDVTVRPARLVPAQLSGAAVHGVESGLGTRLLLGSHRLIATEQGGLLTADVRLPQTPLRTVALPERLGGGFLFVLDTTLWRADRWLDAATPIYASSGRITNVMPGLDRVYLQLGSSVLAIDGRSGAPLDLGPWPSGPHVSSFAAADGWRAAAIVDLRGVVATVDAGQTWHPLQTNLEAKEVVAERGVLAIGGQDPRRHDAWLEVLADARTTPLGARPRSPSARMATALFPPTNALEPTFGSSPLESAVEDGWPLQDSTAIVARKGALARVRLRDGVIVETEPRAFPLSEATCHPLALPSEKHPRGVAFVCGEAGAPTVIYTFEERPHRIGELRELRRFETPRIVMASATGGLTIRGSCEANALVRSDVDVREPSPALKGEDVPVRVVLTEAEGHAKTHAFCIFDTSATWREIRVSSEGSEPRVVPLRDGRIAVVSPPARVRSPARLTLLDGNKVTTHAISMPSSSEDVARILALGMWLDGFEERRPGVLGGWVEASGTMLGIEITLDGIATAGAFIRDAGLPFVSGRYGLGWTASRRGFETTDGGMTWSSVDLPEPLVPAARVERRACGPVGCLGYGWYRVGWGTPELHEPSASPTAHRPPPNPPAPPGLALRCTPETPRPPLVPPSRVPSSTAPHSPPNVGGGFVAPSVLTSFRGLSELEAFSARPAPALREDERALSLDIRELVDRPASPGIVARLYGWGPQTGDWDTRGRWQVAWLSPFGAWTDAQRSSPEQAPPFVREFVAASTSFFAGFQPASSAIMLAVGDDPTHALLVGRRNQRTDLVVYDLSPERPPVEVRRADGQPFGAIEAAVDTPHGWVLATQPAPGSGGAHSIVWRVEGNAARELARVPRTPTENQPPVFSKARLAHRRDGSAVGLVVESATPPGRTTGLRWLVPIDLESGRIEELISLGASDLSDRALEVCPESARRAEGWVFDTSLSSSRIQMHSTRARLPLRTPLARIRMTGEHACLEQLSGKVDDDLREAVERQGPETSSEDFRAARRLNVSVRSGDTRYRLRCVEPPPP
jgi:hypothetical protein